MTSLQTSSPRANSVSRFDAARELILRRGARQSLASFTAYTMPDYRPNWHHEVLCDRLDALLRGEIKRLMVFMPPRHGKSELVSRRLPAFALGVNPDRQIIACSYSADLASRMNRDVQRIIDSPEYQRVFPETKLYGKNIRTVATGSFLRNSDIFEVVGHRGVYRSAGVGGGITGMGFDLGIIDDPIKDYQEASSETVRESVWEWYTSTFSTRQAKGAAILLVMTRWHEDDLAGRLLDIAASDPKADQWTVVRFPAILDEEPGEDDPREQDASLWPDGITDDFLLSQRAQNPHHWDALYQQRPSAKEGAFFKVGKLEIVDALPAGLRSCRGWDLAATPNGGDWTAGVKVAGPDKDGLWYVADVCRGRWATDERNERMKAAALEDDRATIIRLAQDPGAAGVDQAKMLTRMLAGFAVRAERVTGPKVTRADAFASQVNAGNVRLVRGSWNQAFIEELRQFPAGKNDDQVDAVADAFAEIAGGAAFRWA